MGGFEMAKVKNIIVTGSAGFIGFHLSLSLLKDGYNVIGIDSIDDYYSTKLKIKRLRMLEKFSNYKHLKINNFDYHLSLCSLPLFLKIKAVSDINYYPLTINNKIKICFEKNDINIGLSWSGNPNFHLDEYRSLSFENFKDILNI